MIALFSGFLAMVPLSIMIMEEFLFGSKIAYTALTAVAFTFIFGGIALEIAMSRRGRFYEFVGRYYFD